MKNLLIKNIPPMTANITTLALNLLISERLEQRNIFAGKIIAVLDEQSIAENESVLKDNFLLALHKCIEDPNSEIRNVFYQHAQYFTQKNSSLSPAA